MIEAPRPENEKERLKELLSMEIMNSGREEQFDDIAALASNICKAPISLLAFVDETKQYFKAKIGMQEEQTDRKIAFCSHTILNDDIFIVEDTAVDERFHDNPLVTGSPHTRFYAGMPLRTSSGMNIGTLCVLDTEKRELSEEQKTALRLLARQVIKELELRKANLEYQRTINKLESTETLLLQAENLARLGSWEYNISTQGFICTQNVAKLLNISFDEDISGFCTIANALSDPDQEILNTKWQNAINSGKDFEHIALLPGEIEKWVSFRSKTHFSEDILEKVIGYIQDVTELHTHENKLITDKAKAEEATAAKSEFLAIMSHEIRTPLNAIIGLNYLLLQENNIRDEHKETLRAIRFSSQNLLSLINDILDFSKIESGKIEIEKINFRLKDLLNSIRQSIYVKASEKNINLVLAVDEDTPNEVCGDPIKLTQILNNLIGNAIKFTDEGDVKVEVDVIYQNGNEYVLEFSVIDSGIGIPDDKLNLIFERFVQASASTHRSHGGTGLGLAITKRLIELQGGNIEVKSKVGTGSVFTFTITYSAPKVGEAALVQKETILGNGMRGSNILVVDDNIMNQKVAEKLLMSWQAEVGLAENGFVALEKLRTQPFDLVLMDLHMPVMDGIEAIREIRALRINVPIIAFTANSSDDEREIVLNLGGNDYISKPFKPQELYDKIIMHLELRNQ
ncbi:MAG TPA: ATP-binding protein [Anditalea sp.]|nr:ATP-binding protein [Anditalea sp.]